MFQEFPKMLYRDADTTIVGDKIGEEVLRTKGWHDFGQQPKPQGEKPADSAAAGTADAKPAAKRPTRQQPKPQGE